MRLFKILNHKRGSYRVIGISIEKLVEPNEWPFLNFTGKPRRFWIYTRATSKVTIYESVVICMHWQPRARNTRSTFHQRNIMSQGHKKQIMKKIRKTKGMMLLARLYYNFECKTCPIYKPASKIREALIHFPPSLPPFNVEMWFQSYVAKTTLQKGREDNMEQKYKCLKVFEWVNVIKIHVLGKELFCTQLFAFAAKFPHLFTSERCSHNLLLEQYHPFAFLCHH